eukprot:TRINITY_DN2749_c0_g1_i1.p3 TRINITY_DN2749_c0_g1~~TRINITY_DN2749_c0_g1_i1.p3  ORF type:complete len:55 (-),score=19.95 TRINITY_DN2749_c0_g1_i1:41-205(-)
MDEFSGSGGYSGGDSSMMSHKSVGLGGGYGMDDEDNVGGSARTKAKKQKKKGKK